MGNRPPTIGPYSLGERLGAGGMGEVYQAYDQRLDRWVAIKLIRPENAGSATARERFRREARAAARLTHPSIVQIYDIVESDESDAIVLELVDGEPLSSRLARGPLAVDEGVRLGREIADGLAAAHDRGLVHRDLKPENVMVTGEGHAKILDFGLAKRLEGEASLTGDHRVVGTFRSMSPEQARGLPVDARSDLFSLGVLLYEMLSGSSPFAAPTALETLTRVASHRPPSVREVAAVPRRLSDLIDRLLEKEAGRRPRDAREVSRALAGERGELLRPTVSGQVTRTDEGLTPERFSRPAPGRGWLPAGLALLLALGVAGAFLWVQERPRPTLRVAVVRPWMAAGVAPSVELLASGLRFDLLAELLRFPGLRPIPLEQVDEVETGGPVPLARALAADEVLTSRLECPGEVCQVMVTRLDGKDGHVIWSQAFNAPLERPYALREAVRGYLGQAFQERPAAKAAEGAPVRPRDYEEYLRLRQAFEAKREGAGLDPEVLFQRLEAIRRTSPRFLEAYVFESEVRQQRFKLAHDAAGLDRAGELLRRAAEIAPLDPRPRFGEFGLALLRGDLAGAEAALAALERLQPGDPNLLVYRGRLLARRGREKEGLALIREGARRSPSWRNLYRAAEMEQAQGSFEAARADLRELLARYPGSYEGRTLEAQIEFLHGDLGRAAELYARLVARYPRPLELTNLGTSLLYLGRYGEAERSFRRALALEPESPFALLNLADTLELDGRPEEAARLYREAVRRAPLDATDWQVLSVRAQAQAHLQDASGAVESAQTMLRIAPEGAQSAFETSLIYLLLGERKTALFNARRALEQGIEPRIFALRWFDPLRLEPDFRTVLAARSAS